MIDQNDDQGWERTVDKLIDLTERGELKWRTVNLPLRPLMRAFVGPQYVADVEGWLIAVYEYLYPSSGRDFSRPYSESGIRVEFITAAGDPLWVWPAGSGRNELLDVVRKQGTDADQFLEAFLADRA